MAIATAEKRQTLPEGVTDMEAHQADKARRKAERDARRSIMRACMDPDVAKRYEAQKPMYEWDISCEVMETDAKTGKRKFVKLNRKVYGMNEHDAWATFCTQEGRYPSPHSCNREIKQLKRLADLPATIDEVA